MYRVGAVYIMYVVQVLCRFPPGVTGCSHMVCPPKGADHMRFTQ